MIDKENIEKIELLRAVIDAAREVAFGDSDSAEAVMALAAALERLGFTDAPTKGGDE